MCRLLSPGLSCNLCRYILHVDSVGISIDKQVVTRYVELALTSRPIVRLLPVSVRVEPSIMIEMQRGRHPERTA
jgi:hypothetical protein